jgi:hypothetical protein
MNLLLQLMKLKILFAFIISSNIAFCQDSLFLKVHFLYGSTPKKQCKAAEKKWFGGILGGHIGLESGNDKILHFAPKGKFHIFPKQKKHGTYYYNSAKQFYEILGGKLEENKKAIVYIPITATQKILFDSIAKAYIANTPYDYAFTGYRCGSASYEAMVQLGILPSLGKPFTKFAIFYPKKTRKRILHLAAKNNWRIETQNGSLCRKWEKD